jgi:hypothetical protein
VSGHHNERSSRHRPVGAMVLLLAMVGCSGGGDDDSAPTADTATGTAASVSVPATVVLDAPRPVAIEGGEPIQPVFEDFDGARFSNPTVIDNQWFPLIPGTYLVLAGTSVEGGEELAHRIEYIVTDLTKEILGVETVAAWIEDYSDDELVEAELAFYAQDDSGNVWFFGEHPEEYEEEELVDSPTWIAGVDNARPGIMMYAQPEPGLPTYFQGWGPGVEWSDFATVDSVGTEVCVALNCYPDVLTIAESSLGEAGIFQLKSYARGVGTIQVDFRGEDLTQEKLEVVRFEPLSGPAMARYRALSIAMEAHAYDISPTVYGSTPPLQAADASS